MTPDSMSATLALVIIAATIVARVVTSRLIANTRFGLHAWEREHQALLTKLAVIRGQREMVNRDRVRFIHDRSALDRRFDQFEFRIDVVIRQILQRPGRKVIDHKHIVIAREQQIDEVAADKTGTTRYNDAAGLNWHVI